ncbi:hypothetical protein DH2020_031512 [Rehmannia glutinosa]|uniref:Uncharacterized protein n=1 Tax=Rehmannia glutinosa TaxID=99300 RepID=A0ABR0VHX9_REHGL
MEVDGGGKGEESGGGDGGVSLEVEKKNSPEGETKVKRKMKTPSQLEILERTYAMETYPSEALRAELSVKLGLSDRQLQMWFCHRRLKDRKAPTEKRHKKSASSSAVAGSSGGIVHEMVVNNADVAKDSGSGLSPFGNTDLQPKQKQQRVIHKAGTAVPRISTELPPVRRFYEPPLAISEQRAIKFVEAQLGEPLREDGPILGMEFDPLPPGAFGAPIGIHLFPHISCRHMPRTLNYVRNSSIDESGFLRNYVWICKHLGSVATVSTITDNRILMEAAFVTDTHVTVNSDNLRNPWRGICLFFPLRVTSEQQKPAGRFYDAQLYETHDAKPVKGASRALHEYQFLPEKPSARNDAYERAVPPHRYGSPIDIMNARVPLSTGRSIMHSNEQVSSEYLQSQRPSLSLLPQQCVQDLHLSPAPGEVDVTPSIASMVNANIDSHLLVHPITGLANNITTPERRIVLDQERLERKRKAEEARMAKEVETHEKRIRKELEKQDVLRKKREEQMRKEMERQDRERRKEEERLLREKQREEERLQREQKREMERREKFLQKEYIRAEKMRLKEEMRKEKEAARLKAANNRAAARRIAKESVELVEDEILELMELAALSRGLPSILALDSETLQNLNLFKDKLPEFPPESVQLKRPFGVRPWTDSEENIGNLLMVWRFLIAFADVLGLWPFTLDEFTQALHDCDPRLLAEIHIALLRSIIKDIEDVARTPATAMVANQNSAGIPAFSWGFDLLSWQRLLTPLTWPEGNDGADTISNLRSGVAAENAVAIMQERGLSNPRRSRHRLTPGTVKYAAFHVLSLEGSKGLSILEVADRIQRSGLRDLTTSKTPEASISAALSRDTKLFERTAPSTYCVRSPYRKDTANAEEILSEAREKIRVYQNGSVEEEAEDAEKEDLDRDQDSESDVADDPDVDDLDAVAKLKEASRCSETSRFEDVSQYVKENSCSELMETPLDALGNSKSSSTLSQSVDGIKSKGATGINPQIAIHDLENIVTDECGFGEPWIEGLTEGEYADLSTEERLNALVALIGVANEGNAVRIALEERLEAANALKKQMWAEAQLDKRRMKEEHILKSQHSSLAGNRAEQTFPNFTVEHRRSPLSSVYVKNESSSTNPVYNLVDLNDQQNEENYCNSIITEKNPSAQEFTVVSDNLLLQQCAEKSRSELKAFIGHRAEEIYVYRSLPLGQDRRRNRYWQFITSPSRNDPGSGKIFVELCNGGFDALLSSLDVRGIRECHLHSMLRNIGASFRETARKNLLCSNSGVHVGEDVKKKVVESRHKLDLYSGIDSPKSMVCASYSTSPGLSLSSTIELEKNVCEGNDIMERYKDFEWMWKECFDSNVLGALKYGTLMRERLLEICKCCNSLFSWEENHCPSCHTTYKTSEVTYNFAEHVTECKRKRSGEIERILLNLSLPPRVRLLKAQLAMIEASIPSDALKSVWSDEYRKSWGRKLHMASTAEELLQSLTLLEASIKREFLSANYETTSEMLSSSEAVGRCVDTFSRPEVVAILPWIPRTTPAVALRLMELDISIYYTPDQKSAHEKDIEAGYFIKFPSMYSALGSSMANASQAGYLQQDNCWVDLGNGRAILKRGRGRPRGPSRTRGGKSQRRAINSRDDPCNSTTTKDNKLAQLPRWKGRSRARGSSKKGRRSITNRQKKPATRTVGNVVEKRGAKDKIVFDDNAGLKQEEWNLTETTPFEIEGAEKASSSERSESDNDNGQASADEYGDGFSGGIRSGKSEHYTMEREYDERVDDGDDDVNFDDDYNYDDDDDGDDVMDERDNYYDEGYINSDYNEEPIQSKDEERLGKVDRSSDGGSTSSSSSDYSY